MEKTEGGARWKNRSVEGPGCMVRNEKVLDMCRGLGMGRHIGRRGLREKQDG